MFAIITPALITGSPSPERMKVQLPWFIHGAVVALCVCPDWRTWYGARAVLLKCRAGRAVLPLSRFRRRRVRTSHIGSLSRGSALISKHRLGIPGGGGGWGGQARNASASVVSALLAMCSGSVGWISMPQRALRRPAWPPAHSLPHILAAAGGNVGWGRPAEWLGAMASPARWAQFRGAWRACCVTPAEGFGSLPSADCDRARPTGIVVYLMVHEGQGNSFDTTTTSSMISEFTERAVTIRSALLTGIFAASAVNSNVVQRREWQPHFPQDCWRAIAHQLRNQLVGVAIAWVLAIVELWSF